MPERNPPASLRLDGRGFERSGAPIDLFLDGRAIPALEGETVAAALTAAGTLVLRTTPQDSARGLYCGMGVCFECRVTIDGCPGQRACLALVAPGMRIDTHGSAMQTGGGLPPAAPRHKRCAVLVVGAGPAGLAAADAASGLGAEVAILDERPAAGGQYYKPLAKSHGFTGGTPADRQFAAGAKLERRVLDQGVRISQQTVVWDAQALAEGGVVVRALDPDGPVHWRAAKLIVAAGAYERSWPVPGWTLPGVMTTGAAQTLARAYRVAPGRRVLIAGNGPLNLQVAADLANSGVEVVALVEGAESAVRANPADIARLLGTRPDLVWQGLGYLRALRRLGVPLLYRHVLVRVEGESRAARAVVAAIDAGGVVVPGSERSFDVDAVCCGYGFAPASEITRLIGCRHEIDGRNGTTLVAVRDQVGRTSLADIFIAGDAGGAWGAHCALGQGAVAGAVAASDLRGPGAGHTGNLRRAQRRLKRETAFQTSLWRMFAMPDVANRLATDDTIVCRCENVTFGAVRREIAQGAGNLAAIKRATRCGMGHCQGRYCSQSIAGLLAASEEATLDERTFFRVQIPVRPVPIGAIARAHADAAAPAPLHEVPGEPVQDTDTRIAEAGTLVIGAGVIGLCIARELARNGEDVLVLDRGMPHAEASGVNAGSLHVQFQTFGFPDLDGEAARNAASTLALQRDAVYLWKALAQETGADCEIEIEGGLTVADDAASLAHLRRKVEIERSAGLAIDLLTGDEARRIAPYLSTKILAASLSRDEGKLNPLKAAPAVLAAARAAGIRLETHTRVTGIERSGPRFLVRTDRGTFSAGRIVNAAGAWAGSIAALAGDCVPLRPNPIQMLVTEALPPTIPFHLAHATRRLTLKQAASGNLVIGGGWKAAFDARSRRMRVSAEGFAGNLAVVYDMLPRLGALLVIRSWTGTAFITAPVIGESARTPGLFHAVAQNGMTLGPAIGRICAGQILGRKPEYDLERFTPDRFS